MTVEKQKASASEVQPDRVRAALEALKDSTANLARIFDDMKVEDIQQVIDQAVEQKIGLTRERFDIFRREALNRAAAALRDAQKTANETTEQLQRRVDEMLPELDKRLAILQQTVSDQFPWMRDVGETLSHAWEKFLSLAGVRQVVDFFKGFFPESKTKQPEEQGKASGIFAFLKGAGLGFLGGETVRSIPRIGPKIAEAAEQNAVLDAVGRTVVEYRVSRKKTVFFDETLTSSDWRAFRTALGPWQAGGVRLEDAASAYVMRYLDQSAGSATTATERPFLPVFHIGDLASARLAPNMPLAPAAAEPKKPQTTDTAPAKPPAA